MGAYNSLMLQPVRGKLGLPEPKPPAAPVATLHASALSVMTDLVAMPAVVTRDITPIGEALEFMKQSGVRLLFVRDSDQRLLGLITSYDIQGEKPLRHLQSMNCTHATCTCSWEQIRVRDIMVPVSDWPVLHFHAVERACVGNIVATFKAACRRHLIVVQTQPEGENRLVRGLFSASQLEKQLGLTIEALCPATTFAQIERVLAQREECE